MELKHKILVYAAVFVIVVLSLSIAMVTPIYTGRFVEVNNLDDALNNMDQLTEDYNQNVDKVPGFVIKIFGNEVINATMERNDGSTVTLKIKTVDGRIVAVNNVNDSTTLRVRTNEETFDKILNSNDQMGALKEALENKDIEYEGVTVTTKIKTGLAGILFKIASWFF